MSRPIDVVAIIQGRPGTQAALEAAIAACTGPTRAESGCLSYVAHRDLEVAARYVFIERWDGQASLDAHMATPHLKAFGASLASLGAPLQVLALEAIEA